MVLPPSFTMMACRSPRYSSRYGGYGTAREQEDLETCRHAVDNFPAFSAMANDLPWMNRLNAHAGTISSERTEQPFGNCHGMSRFSSQKRGEAMSFISSGEFELAVAEEVAERLRIRHERSNSAVLNGENDVVQWVAAHQDSARVIVCNWPGVEGASFCGCARHIDCFEE